MFDIDIKLIDVEKFSSDAVSGNRVAVRWLGQAGFEFFYKGYHLMIDPYLSNSLAKKYAGKEFSHSRMMPSSLVMSKINDLDFILCTHRHSDHMDPETLTELQKFSPACKLIAPRAEADQIKEIGIDVSKTLFVNADENFDMVSGINLDVIASSHEDLKVDEDGNHHYLGYILRLGDVSIYHSGDCVPNTGLVEEIKRKKIDIAMLPINGRDEYRHSRGVPGNFTLEEGLQLCKDAEIPVMICHHFGMFDFNTVDSSEIEKKLRDVPECLRCLAPEIGVVYEIKQHYK